MFLALNLVDAHNDHSAKIQWLKKKLLTWKTDLDGTTLNFEVFLNMCNQHKLQFYFSN